MSNIYIPLPPAVELPKSKIGKDFWEKYLWPQAMKHSLVTSTELCEVSRVESFAGMSEFFISILDRRFSSQNIHFVLGPITNQDQEKMYENLQHFLLAQVYHSVKGGRKVFPQTVFSPVVSHLVQSRIDGGEDKDVVHQEILTKIYLPVFEHLSQAGKMVTGWFLEGYENSLGAQWEYEYFEQQSWSIKLPQSTLLTNACYRSNLPDCVYA